MHDLQNLNEDPERKFQNEVTAAVDDLVYIFIRKQFYVSDKIKCLNASDDYIVEMR